MSALLLTNNPLHRVSRGSERDWASRPTDRLIGDACRVGVGAERVHRFGDALTGSSPKCGIGQSDRAVGARPVVPL